MLAGDPPLAVFVVLSVLYGVGGGLVVPAEVGLIPETVSAERLQQANALRAVARRDATARAGDRGVAVVAAGPGWSLALDGLSFVGCALLLAAIRVPARDAPRVRASFVADLRDGWHAFASRTWLWTTVVVFGLRNACFMSGSCSAR